ncbi:MAG: serine/threonine protein kinase [Myxococcales bacterium]|nr:serine/threonine protein kinase [Myxococcales bacterium]
MPAPSSGQFDAGTRIDERYEIVEQLGSGGFGTVYRARQLNMDREVAVKVIRRSLVDDDRIVARFLREARAVSRLKNPHIVPVFDFGQTADGLLYLVMELLPGRTLKQVFADEAPLAPPRLCRLLAQVCEALAEAHGHRAPGADRDSPIVHRDLKPENIIVVQTRTGAEHCYLLDFGIVRMDDAEGDVALTAGGFALGTPHYMAPEQARGERPGPAADLWALGVLMYQGLTRRLPFTGAGPSLILTAVMRDPPLPFDAAAEGLDVPPAVRALVHDLLEKDPARRPANASVLQSRLLDAGGGRPRADDATWGPSKAGPDDTADPGGVTLALPTSRARPGRAGLIGAAVALAIVVVVAVLAGMQARSARTPPPSPRLDAPRLAAAPAARPPGATADGPAAAAAPAAVAMPPPGRAESAVVPPPSSGVLPPTVPPSATGAAPPLTSPAAGSPAPPTPTDAVPAARARSPASTSPARRRLRLD